MRGNDCLPGQEPTLAKFRDSRKADGGSPWNQWRRATEEGTPQGKTQHAMLKLHSIFHPALTGREQWRNPTTTGPSRAVVSPAAPCVVGTTAEVQRVLKNTEDAHGSMGPQLYYLQQEGDDGEYSHF